MSLSRFVETLLIRDILSYFIPGMGITLILIRFNLDFGILQFIVTTIKSTVGDAGVILGCSGIIYTIGYLASTVVFYMERFLPFKNRFHISEPKPEIIKSLEQAFGNWVKNADRQDLAIVCQNYLELKEPDYYFRKLDRLILLRNFEIGIASVFLALSISLFYSLSNVLKLFGFMPLIITIILMFSSKTIKFDMFNKTFISFYVSQKKTVQLDPKD